MIFEGSITPLIKLLAASMPFIIHRIYFPERPGFQPADAWRCTAFPHAAQSVKRRTHHPCRGHETKER